VANKYFCQKESSQMAKGSSTSANKKSNTVFKRTSQGGSRPKTSAMNKDQKKAFKHYRGQGK
jgi:hypothetical protein